MAKHKVTLASGETATITIVDVRAEGDGSRTVRAVVSVNGHTAGGFVTTDESGSVRGANGYEDWCSKSVLDMLAGAGLERARNPQEDDQTVILGELLALASLAVKG